MAAAEGMRFRALHLLVVLLAIDGVVLARPARNAPTLSRSAPKSVIAALLESPVSNFMELVDRAGLLERLESAVGEHNLTIFAPWSDFFDQHLDPGFKRYLLAPSNVAALRSLVLWHVFPRRITSSEWQNATFATLLAGGGDLRLGWSKNGAKITVNRIVIDAPDMILRDDGVAHGIDGLLVPKSVSDAYAAFRLKNTPPAEHPRGAPEPKFLDSSSKFHRNRRNAVIPGTNFEEQGPHSKVREQEHADASAPAPAPSSLLDGDDVDDLVADFTSALSNFGEYREMAELLVNLTSLASEMGRLVVEGHRITILAPNDEAIDRLTTNHLNSPGGIEAILAYHVLAEYHTEESLYTMARRTTEMHLETLSPGMKLPAREVDGTVQFGRGAWSGQLLDPNIFEDGRISVQGINNVLIPPEDSKGRKLLWTRGGTD